MTIKQHKRGILLNTDGQYMKEANTLADNVIIKHVPGDILFNTIRAVHEGLKYPCKQCDYQAGSKGNFADHKTTVHKGVKFPCRQCDYKATQKGRLAEHKQAVHEVVKYPGRQCDHQATAKGSLAQHKRAVHAVVKYPGRAGNVTIKQRKRGILLNTNGQYMKE